MPHFLVCLHDATPAFDVETRAMLRDLAPLIGRRLCVGVVPDWAGAWPLERHPEYCRLILKGSSELLLHGYFHRRRSGWGAASLLTGGCDEMNGLGIEATRRTLERGQRVFKEALGSPARGFLAPGWQRGSVRATDCASLGLEHVLGFFSLESSAGASVALATWTWDCGRWGWLGHVGHGLGWLLHSTTRRVPVLAIHPRDAARGFRPGIVRVIERLLEAGYEPATASELMEAPC